MRHRDESVHLAKKNTFKTFFYVQLFSNTNNSNFRFARWWINQKQTCQIDNESIVLWNSSCKYARHVALLRGMPIPHHRNRKSHTNINFCIAFSYSLFEMTSIERYSRAGKSLPKRRKSVAAALATRIYLFETVSNRSGSHRSVFVSRESIGWGKSWSRVWPTMLMAWVGKT